MNKTTIVDNQTKENATCSKATKRIREDKSRKKDEKSLEHVFRTLDGLGSTEHKLGAMCQKYAEMYQDHRLLQAAVKQAEKKNTVLQKEKEQLQSEHSKAILTRSRLENLCRELQRQNKAVKEECMLKMREEGEKKREVAAKFHSMLSEIGSLLAQNNNKNAKLRDDNLDMSMRLKSVCDQFEKKEQHVENLAKQMELEMQLADAKLAKAKMEMDIEKETLEKEKQQLVIELAEYKRKLVEMKASELTLREQITMYSDKYEEFHKALLQSNSAIGEFKAEMERMTKHIRRLEKETATWMSRYDAAQRTLAEVSQAKLRSDEALGRSQRRLIALQGICRGLQDQCRQLRGEQRRDSQAEEEFKKLEDQIKDVERSAEIDYRSCPRKASCGTVTEVLSEEIQPLNVANYDTNNITSDSSDNSNVKVKEIESLVNSEDPKSTNGPSVLVNSVESTGESAGGIENVGLKCHNNVNISENIGTSDLCEVTENASITENEENLEPNQNDKSETNRINGIKKSCTSLPLSEPDAQKSIEDCVNSLVNHVQEVSLVEGNMNLNKTNQINNTQTKVENSSLNEQFFNETEHLSKNCQSIFLTQAPCAEEDSTKNNSFVIKPETINENSNDTKEIIIDEISEPLIIANETLNSSNTDNDQILSGATEILPQAGGNNPEEVNQIKNKKKRKNKK